MQEVQLKKETAAVAGEEGRKLILFLRQKSFVISGNWQWELLSNAVFCSDVMVFPQHFEGTKAIIYPDDLPQLLAVVEKNQDAQFKLSFRIITTYGETQKLQGTHLQLEIKEDEDSLPLQTFHKAREEHRQRKEQEFAAMRRAGREIAERINRSGTWFFNLSTSETWYSDQVYHIHGISPQSLNAHLHTFHSFIHPEDHKAVLEALDAALTTIVPLNIEYRIVTTGDEERTVHQSINWAFNDVGEMVLHGLFRDVSEQHQLDEALEGAETSTGLQKQLLHFAENSTSIGYWQLNVVTRRLIFSDNYYRLFGLKPQSIPASSSSFLNYIHPDDREIYEEVIKRIRKEHTVPEIDFRIMRPDGKTRYVRQKGRAGIAGKELVMMGTLQDITVQKALEKKLSDQQEALYVNNFTYRQAEATAGIGSWLWNINTGEISWSDNFYEMLGLKPQAVKFTQKTLQQAIHPEDQKLFSDALSLMLKEKIESDFIFRLISKGAIHYMKAGFRMLAYNDTELFVGTVQDVTGQEEIKKTLTDRIRMIEHLSDSIPDIIIVTDTDNNIVLWNHRSEEMFQRKKDKAIGENFFELLPQMKEERAVHYFNRALSGETVLLENYQPAGLLKGFYNVSIIPLTGENNKVIGVLHLLRDVTSEHKLHLQLSGRLQLIESLVEASVDRIIALDKNMNYLYWNKKAEEYYKLKKQEVLGKNILEIFPRHQKLPSYAQFREALRGKTVHLPADSRETEAHTEIYLIPVLNEKNDPDTVLWISHDLTKEYTLVQQLKENKEFFQSVIDSSLDVIQVFEAVRDDNGEILDFTWKINNSRAVAQNGEVIGESLLQRNPGVVASGIFARMVQVTETGVPHEQEQFYSYEQFKGQWFYIALVKQDDGVLMTTRDITKQKKAEEEIKHSRELLQATMNASVDMIQVFGAVRNESGEIVDFRYVLLNHEAEKWMPGALGKSLLELQPGVVEEGIFDSFRQVVETGIPQQYERHYVHEQFNGWFYQTVVKLNDGVATTTRDITERKKAEQEVLRLKDEIAQQATNKYSTLFNSIDEGFSIIDLIHDDNGNLVDFIYSEINPAFTGHVGVDLRGKRRSELYFDKKDFVLEKYAHLAKTGEPLHFEHHVQALGDQWFQVSASRIGGEGSTQLGVVFRNITERKQQEQKQQYLLQLSDALRTFSDPDEILNEALKTVAGYLDLDRIGYNEIDPAVTEYWYRACYAREGFTPVLGRFQMGPFQETVKNLQKGITFIANDAYADSFSEAEKEVHRSINVGAYVTVPLVKAGRWVCNLVAHYSQPRKWTVQEIAILEETAERIWAAVERAKAEEALRDSEARLQLAIGAANLGTFVWHIAEDLSEPDAKARQHFGLPPDSTTSLKEALATSFHPEDAARYAAAVAEAIDPAGPGTLNVEFRIRRPDGQERWMMVSGTTVFESIQRLPVRMHGVLADITDRKYAEEQLKDFALMMEQEVERRTAELKENKEFVEAITDSIPDIVTIVHNQTGTVEYANRDAVEHMGFDYETLFTKTPEELRTLLHPDDLQALKAYFESFSSLHGREERTVEYRVKNKYGEWLWLNMRGKIFKKEANGAGTHSLNVCRNITAYKNAETELRKHYTILHHTEELAQIGSWEYEMVTGEFTWSDGMYQLFGLRKGMNVRPEIYLDHAVEEDRSAAKRIIKNLKKTHQPFEEIMRIKRGNEERLLRIKASLVKDEKGLPQKLVGVDLDITDIKLAEEKVKETEHWLQQTAQASPDSISVYDLQNKTPLYLNNCLSEWTGYNSYELISMGIEGRLQLIHPDDRLPLLHFNEKMKMAKDGDVLTIEYRIHSKDYKERWIRNRSKVFLRDASEKVTHLLSVLQDVSEEKAAESLLKSLNTSLEKQNRELESKNDEITSFAFVASHDLREPLRKIHTFSDWLLQKEEGLSDTGKQTLSRLMNSVKRLDALVEDIVAITKVHIEKEDLHDVNLNTVLCQARQELKDIIERSGTEIVAGELPVIKGLQNQLVYLFRNLFSNCIKFQQPGNKPIIQINARCEGEFIKLEFKDNGIGFPPEYSKRIFQMFRRLHGKQEYEGTGMGLAICKRIMEKHGGNITADGQPGDGATFTCWFPT